MAKKRNGRQDAIRDIVRNKDVRTQRVLVDELRAMGFDCTQATVSRDIADMGLRKLPEGIYDLARLPASPPPLMRQSCPMCLARLPATIRFWLLPRRPRTASVSRR